MHIIVMLFLVIAGYALGENVTYIFGLPVICAGLYIGFGDWGGKRSARMRADQEGVFFLLGLVGIVIVILDEIF